MSDEATVYFYRGDRLTNPAIKGRLVRLVRRADGKCVRGRNGNILAVDDLTGERIVVLAYHLRKVKL